jgi:hypothetical protein
LYKFILEIFAPVSLLVIWPILGKHLYCRARLVGDMQTVQTAVALLALQCAYFLMCAVGYELVVAVVDALESDGSAIDNLINAKWSRSCGGNLFAGAFLYPLTLVIALLSAYFGERAAKITASEVSANQ